MRNARNEIETDARFERAFAGSVCISPAGAAMTAAYLVDWDARWS
jgi:hypothetical protein